MSNLVTLRKAPRELFGPRDVVLYPYFGTIVIVPVASVLNESKTKISRVVGFDSTDITWQSSVAIVDWQLRLVFTPGDSRTMGALVKSATGVNVPANTDQVTTITDDELVNAGGVDGANILKLFVKTADGTWSV